MWSAGVLMCELLTVVTPYRNKKDTLEKNLHIELLPFSRECLGYWKEC